MRARSGRGDDVELVRRQLEQWRRRRGRGSRIPEPVWKAVVKLARGYGVSRIARTLRVDYYSIKSRLDAAEPPPRAIGAVDRFVELPLRAMSAPPACVLEAEDGRGARLRLELQGIDASELAGVVRAVWSEPR